MATRTLPLEPVVNIIVNLSARSAVRKQFNLALLMGEVPAAVDFGSARIKTYSTLTEMLEDGFTLTDRLYKAAALVLGQSKVPPKVAIGKIGSVAVTPTEEGGDTSRKETPVETLKACREADGEWYVGIYCAEITNAQILDCVEYIEAVRPTSIFAYTTTDANCLNAESADGIFAKLKAKNYRRAFGQYSTKHPDAVAAIVGWAMGAMTGTSASAYTLAYKTEVGVETENSDAVFQSSNVDAIKGDYGNVFINRGTYYDIFEEGTLSDGTWFDELIFLDKYQNDMQLSLMDLLYQNNKIPQTESGMTRLKEALKVVCDEMYNIGIISGGVWKSTDILGLSYGDVLPNGYLIQSEAIDDQSQADRDARKAPPIYVSLKLAGATHHVTVQVDVNR